jgi:2-amino-4-hydroxy-6-hydroxymethyldihydropteridine diphosphokinase
MKKKVVLSIGSNLGNRYALLKLAIKELQLQFDTKCEVSKFYLTAPWGNKNQSSFINAALTFDTSVSVYHCLELLQKIEMDFGREKTEKWGPRALDLDIIFWGDETIETHQVTIPHKHLAERDFVLKPLMDIVPDFSHPQSQATVRDLYFSISDNTTLFSKF